MSNEPKALLTIATLREIADRLLALEKHNRETETDGFTEPIYVTADTSQPNGKAIDVPKKPWFAITISNDGPNDAQYIIVTQKMRDESPRPLSQWVTIRVGESQNEAFSKGIILYILYRTTAGTAKLRVVGTR